MKILKCRLSKKCLSAPDITGDFCKSLPVRIKYCQGFFVPKTSFFRPYPLEYIQITKVVGNLCILCLPRQNYIGYRLFLCPAKVVGNLCILCLPRQNYIEYRPLLQDTKTAGTLCNSNGERENPQVTGHFCNSLAVRITYYQGILGPQTSLPVRINTNSKAQIHRLPTVFAFGMYSNG